MSDDPIKRLAWLRADCAVIRRILSGSTSRLSRPSLQRRLEDDEREIAAIEAHDPSMVEALSATTAIDALAALVGAP